jgi:hypothetical protein
MESKCQMNYPSSDIKFVNIVNERMGTEVCTRRRMRSFNIPLRGVNIANATCVSEFFIAVSSPLIKLNSSQRSHFSCPSFFYEESK